LTITSPYDSVYPLNQIANGKPGYDRGKRYVFSDALVEIGGNEKREA
jgi:hypothetical protein